VSGSSGERKKRLLAAIFQPPASSEGAIGKSIIRVHSRKFVAQMALDFLGGPDSQIRACIQLSGWLKRVACVFAKD